MSRSVRAIALWVVSIVGGASIAGCAAAPAILGIHEPPKANAASAPLTVDQARSILTRDFTAAQQGETTTGAAALAAQRTAYTGEGLRAANARVKLAKVQPSLADSPALAPQQPRLLALSRGFGFPRVIVAQTLSSEGPLPILHLLTSPDAATPYRISASATMLLASTVKPFDALTKGSPLVTDGAGLAVAPTALLNAYAAGMAFPAKAVTNPPFAADTYAAQVRAGAAQVAQAVASPGDLLAGPQGRPQLRVCRAAGQRRRAGLRGHRAHGLLRGEGGPGRQHRCQQSVCPADRQEAGHQGRPRSPRLSSSSSPCPAPAGRPRWLRPGSRSSQGRAPDRDRRQGQCTHDFASHQRGCPSWRRGPVRAQPADAPRPAQQEATDS